MADSLWYLNGLKAAHLCKPWRNEVRRRTVARFVVEQGLVLQPLQAGHRCRVLLAVHKVAVRQLRALYNDQTRMYSH